MKLSQSASKRRTDRVLTDGLADTDSPENFSDNFSPSATMSMSASNTNLMSDNSISDPNAQKLILSLKQRTLLISWLNQYKKRYFESEHKYLSISTVEDLVKKVVYLFPLLCTSSVLTEY